MFEVVGIILGFIVVMGIVTAYRMRDKNTDPLNNCEIISKLNLNSGRKFVIIEYSGQKFAVLYSNKDSQLIQIK